MISLQFSIAISLILIMLIFIMRNFENIVKNLRDICEEPSGYFKFGQILIMFFVIFSFLSILLYDIFVGTRIVSSIDILLTVTVGLLGTIVGLFFGSRAEHHISRPREEAVLRSIKGHQKIRDIMKILIDMFK